MRVLILDDDSGRADDVNTVLGSKLASLDICNCRRPADVGYASKDFDFVVLHFRNEGTDNGINAYAFLDGLMKEEADEPSLPVQREYFALGYGIRTSDIEPLVLVYSGGAISEEQRDTLRGYGQTVCVREGVGSHQLSAEFSMCLRRALKTGRLAFDHLCPKYTRLPFLSALLILCQGWLIACVDPTTGKPDLDGGEANPAYPEFIQALQQMTGQELRDVPRFVSSILPAELMDRNQLERIRASVSEAAWWRVIAQPNLARLIGQEAVLESVSGPGLANLLNLLTLIENKKPVLDVGMVASAYNATSSLVNDPTGLT